MIELDKNIQNDASKDARVMKWIEWGIRAGLGLLIAGVVYMLLPFAVTATANVFQIALNLTKTAFIGVIGGAFLYTFWKSKSLLKRFLDRMVSNLWERFIKDDPIKYISEEIIGFREHLNKVAGAIRKLMGILDELRTMGQEAIDDASRNIQLAEAAGNETQANLYAYYAKETINTKEGILESYKEIEESVAVMNEVQEMLDTNIKMMEHDVKQMQTNLRIQQVKSSAADSVKSIIEGNPNQRARREIAMQAYKEKVSAYSANFKQTMGKLEPLIASKRIEDAITTKQGQDLLKEFRENGKKLAGLNDFKSQLEQLKQQTGFFGDGDDKAAFKRIQNSSAEPLKRTGKYGNL